MSRKCCIRTCRELSGESLRNGYPEPKAFWFPRDEFVKPSWELFVNHANRTENFVATAQTICARHFEPSCFLESGKLMPNSIPTIADRFSLEVAKKYHVTSVMGTFDLNVINNFSNTVVKLREGRPLQGVQRLDQRILISPTPADINLSLMGKEPPKKLKRKSAKYTPDQELQRAVQSISCPTEVGDNELSDLTEGEISDSQEEVELVDLVDLSDEAHTSGLPTGDEGTELNMETDTVVKKESCEMDDVYSDDGERMGFEQVFIKEEKADQEYYAIETNTISEQDVEWISSLCGNPFPIKGDEPSTSTQTSVESYPGYQKPILACRSLAEWENSGEDADDPDIIEYVSVEDTLQGFTGLSDIEYIDKPYECGQCIRRFARKRHLALHMRKHVREEREGRQKLGAQDFRPIECNECHKRFAKLSYLKEHMRLHSSEKSYECPECDQRYFQNASLASHIMRRHSGAKPFHCHECDKRFPQLYLLRKHLATHSEAPAQCPLCSRQFKRKSHLRNHMKSHAQLEKLFKCDVCQEGFDRVDPLIEHMRSHAKVNG